jgi:hypothetical protein
MPALAKEVFHSLHKPEEIIREYNGWENVRVPEYVRI